MFRVLHASHNGRLCVATVRGTGGIAELVRNNQLESLASSDRQFDFWFTPSTRPTHHHVNRTATEILLACTQFTANDIPLLRGDVVVATHDPAGDATGLTQAQLDRLGAIEARGRDRQIVLRRSERQRDQCARVRDEATWISWLHGP